MSHQPNHIYEFGPYHLDVAEHLLLRNEENIPLQPKAFDLLLVLVRRHGHLLEKEELLEAVWPDTIVEEVNLANNVSILRKALSEGANGRRFIETVPRRGYRFVAPVREGEAGIGDAETGEPPAVVTEQEEPVVTETNRQVTPGVEPSTPSPSRRIKKRAGLVILLAIGIAGAIGFRDLNRRPAAPNAAIKSIAVLPFKPLLASGRDEAMDLGMADALITRLSGLRQLNVRPTSAVRKYTALDQDPLAAGREQKVDAVLEASYHWTGEKIRVTGRLLEVRDGAALWAYQSDEFCTDIFMAQDVISEKVARALTLKLTGGERQMLIRPDTENKQARLLYLKGRYHWNKNTPAGYWKAIESFQQALSEDPRYAPAYSWLAASYNLLGINSELPPQEAKTKAQMYASKALELDETQDMAHLVLGSLKLFYEWDWPGAERELKRALEINPGNAEGRLALAYSLAFVGRTDEAVAEVKKGQEVDPLSLLVNTAVATMLYLARQDDQAIEQCRKTLELDPNFSSAHYWLALAYLDKSMKTEAIAEVNQWLKLSGRSAESSPDLGYIHALSGRRVEAQRVLDSLEEVSTQSYVDPL
ncbi:MAG: tetratricopeptide repeat protein, partial [Blastocatellia bacterium]